MGGEFVHQTGMVGYASGGEGVKSLDPGFSVFVKTSTVGKLRKTPDNLRENFKKVKQ